MHSQRFRSKKMFGKIRFSLKIIELELFTYELGVYLCVYGSYSNKTYQPNDLEHP